MYKISFINDKWQYKTIKDGINPDFGFSYLEQEKRNTKESSINVSVFFQEELPTLERVYWKIEGGVVVNMNADETAVIDSEISLVEKIDTLKWNFTEENIRISLLKSLTLPGADYYNFSHNLQLDNIKYKVVKNELHPEADILQVYFGYLLKKDGFYLENETLKFPDPRLTIDNLSTLSEDENKIF